MIKLKYEGNGGVMRKINDDFFKDWNYKKHAKFCTAVYAGLYAFDMTISYFIIKKMLKKVGY